MKIHEINLNITENEYRDIERISYSLLSGISKDGYKSLKSEFKHNSATKFGILTESLLFGDFNENDYVFLSEDIISEGKLKTACDIIFNLIYGEDPSEDLSDYITDIELLLDSGIYVDYWDKKEAKWRANKIVNEGSDYWRHCVTNNNKMVMTKKEKDNADITVATLKSHLFTRNIFETNNFFNIEKISQFKTIFTLKGKEFKSMLDWLIIDHDNKTISAYDLKTGGKQVEDFEESFYYWRYDIQSYLYSVAVKIMADKHYPGYVINPFKFIYISREDPYRPLIWVPTSKHYKGTHLGFYRNGEYYKGIYELINDYIWFSSDENIQYTEKVYKLNGELHINDNIIINHAKN